MTYENHTSTDSHLFIALIVGALVWVAASVAQPQAQAAEQSTTVACATPDAAGAAATPASKIAAHRS